MIPDSLLIQVDPVRWIGGFSAYHILVALTFTLIFSAIYIGWYTLSRKRKLKYERNKQILPLPEKNDPDFLLKSSSILRNYIRILYLPKESTAHTATEISHYVSTERIIEALKLIEIHEYSETIMEDEKKGKILAIIEELEEKIRNL